jgi:hypothetical protein
MYVLSSLRASVPAAPPVGAGLYHDLITDRLGRRIRLEQERIDWAWAAERLSY